MNTPETDKPKTKPGLKLGRMFIIAAVAVGAVLIVLISFAGGVFTGFHKAKFSCDWGKNYERNFVGSKNGRTDFLRGFEGRDFRNAHGLAGTIISISNNNLVVKDKDGKENTIVVTDKTMIKNGRDDARLADLKQDDRIVIMGSPDESGVINAVLIRMFN